MLSADELLFERMNLCYNEKVKGFFNDLQNEDFTDKELEAVPALFMPGWGELYSSSVLKIAVAGKETLYWANEFGDSLLTDYNAFKEGKYTTSASCKQYRKEGPAEWRNPFWQYAATAIGNVFALSKIDVLQSDNPVLNSIAWFNGHALETYESNGVDKQGISWEKMARLQQLMDKNGLSDFETFVDVFAPHVILYFYRDSYGKSTRTFAEKNCEFRQSWGENDNIHEYQLGQSIILNMRHTTWMKHKRIPERYCAELILEILKARGIYGRLPSTKSQHFDLYSMSASMWRHWVEIVRNEAELYPEINNWDLSRHLILTVARELRKINSTMTAQTLVLILNEVTQFRNTNWLYSPERRGPCSSVKGAYNSYASNSQMDDANTIARAFTKLNGEMAYE